MRAGLLPHSFRRTYSSFDLTRSPVLQHGKTPLHTAALSGATECIKILVENGADVDAVTSVHSIAACASLSYRSLPSIRSVDLSASSWFCCFLLVHMLQLRCCLVHSFLSICGLVSCQDGSYAIGLAAHFGHSEAIDMLVAKGADPNVQESVRCSTLDVLPPTTRGTSPIPIRR